MIRSIDLAIALGVPLAAATHGVNAQPAAPPDLPTSDVVRLSEEAPWLV